MISPFFNRELAALLRPAGMAHQLWGSVCTYCSLQDLTALRDTAGDTALAIPFAARRPGETWWSLRRLRHLRSHRAHSARRAVVLWPQQPRVLLLVDSKGTLHSGTLPQAGEQALPRPVPHLHRVVSVSRYQADRALVLDAQGCVLVFSDILRKQRYQLHPLPHAPPAPVAAISASDTHYLLLCDDGVAWSGASSWKRHTPALGRGGSAGQARRVAGLPPGVVHLEAGPDASYFVSASGELWVCGHNLWDQLGLDHPEDRAVRRPVRVPLPPGVRSPVRSAAAGSGVICTLHQDGSVCAGGWCGPLRSTTLQPWLQNAARVVATDCHVVVLFQNGRVWTSGSFAKDGKLGHHTNDSTQTSYDLHPVNLFPGRVHDIDACNIHVPEALTLAYLDPGADFPVAVGGGILDPLPLGPAPDGPGARGHPGGAPKKMRAPRK